MITLQCAGNRGKELVSKDKVGFKKGTVLWGAGAIGNQVWKGEKLSSFLKRHLPHETYQGKWIIFIGRDKLPTERVKIASLVSDRKEEDLELSNFSMGIKCEDVFSKNLADGMLLVTHVLKKDKFIPLPHNHDGPIRAILGGTIGARSVKWIQEIRLSENPPVVFMIV